MICSMPAHSGGELIIRLFSSYIFRHFVFHEVGKTCLNPEISITESFRRFFELDFELGGFSFCLVPLFPPSTVYNTSYPHTYREKKVETSYLRIYGTQGAKVGAFLATNEGKKFPKGVSPQVWEAEALLGGVVDVDV